MKQVHDLTIAGHPGARPMYDTIGRSYCWPQIANYVYAYVEKRPSCRKRYQHSTNPPLLRLFSLLESLIFVAIDTHCALPMTRTSNQFIVVMTDRYWKLTQGIPTKKTTAKEVARIFVEDLVVLYCIPDRLLAGSNAQFAENVFEAVCAALGTKLLMTSAYHPQTTIQARWNNKTIFSRHRHYIVKHQHSWYTFFQTQTYTYSARTDATTKTTAFRFAMTKKLPTASGLPHSSHVSSLGEASLSSKELQRKLLNQDGLMQPRAVVAAPLARQQYKTNLDKHIRRALTSTKDDIV